MTSVATRKRIVHEEVAKGSLLEWISQLPASEPAFCFLSSKENWGGSGMSAAKSFRGSTRFDDAQKWCRDLAEHISFGGFHSECSEEDLRDSIRFVFSFSFSNGVSSQPWLGLPASLGFLPSQIVRETERNGLHMLSVTGPEEPAGLVDHNLAGFMLTPSGYDRWQKSVQTIQDEIEKGSVSKVVLARWVAHEGQATTTARLAELQTRFPSCLIYWLRLDDETEFFGATPELLIKKQGDMVDSMALAGTIPAQYQRKQLLNSDHYQAEQKIVLKEIQHCLRPYCASLSVDQDPEVMQLANVHHLVSRLHGKLYPGVSLLDLVARLHPTPALGGFPAKFAQALIDKCEDFDRGWYGGPVGWQSMDGDGKFYVALRAALRRKKCEFRFAGSGIIKSSDAYREWQETDWKLSAVGERSVNRAAI